ncbi:protein kinase [Novymonas esmeraldas]|uniref:Protein kinase n=1 Tax=Novymonas esmeraldas TaxID=1808958 RepID=A0AAW0EZA6_9TRYP
MDGALAKLPATRWDRLLAVLEENEPERAIDAPHILERAKKLGLSDLELFYLLLMRYQDKQPEILIDVVSLYAMMSTWVEWLVQVQHCLDARKGKMDPGGSLRPTATLTPPSHGSCELADSANALRSRSCSNYVSSPLSSNPSDGPCAMVNGDASRPDSATRGTRNRVSSAARGFRSKAGRGSHLPSHHWCFDLGPEWQWDGSLDFLRNGRVLSCLVEEALDHSGNFEVLQDDHRAHPEALKPGTYEILYPSLADIDRVGKAAPAGDGAAGGANGVFDPVNYLSTFDASRLSRSRRGKVQPSKALKMIEQQGKNLAAAEQWVRKLNGMCEHFLGWKKSAHKGRDFFDLCNPDNLVRPLNSDDARLLYRMHWLAVALYRVVKDPSIVPAPPRMSFIVCQDSLAGLLDTSDEDNQIGLLVATKCSCLPLKTRLSVTMKNFNMMQLIHPDMKQGPSALPCTVVKDEVFAYFEEYHAFLPVWSVFQYYIKHFDGLTWCFEMNRQEREQESQVLGCNSAALRAGQGSSDDFGHGSGSGATFDLTMQSSTVRHNRQHRTSTAPGHKVPRSGNGSRAAAAAAASGSPLANTTPAALLPPRSPQPLAAQSSAGVTAGLGHTTVRHNRVAAAASSPRLDTATASHTSSPCATPRDGGAAVTAAFSKGVDTAAPSAHGGTAPTSGNSADSFSTRSDVVSNSIKSPNSELSQSMPVTRQETQVAVANVGPSSAMHVAPQPALRPAADRTRRQVGSAEAEGEALLLHGAVVRMAAKEQEVFERDHAVGAPATDPALMTPSCTISCSPSSQMMVTRESHFRSGVGLEVLDEEEEMVSDATTTRMCSESHKIIRNFTASVVLESQQSGIAILSHHFRVSSGPIGKGAFGAVYRALNLDTGRIVAVKQSRYSYDDKTTDLNWREFQMWSMLPPHANVIIFYGASKEVDTHQLLLVLEYASGGSIVQLYRHFRPIPEPLFYDHAFGMARGLKHLHDHNVIHGDVKPENVLTRSDGSVAISDFGCSRFSLVSGDSSSCRSARRESGSWQLFGTAAYMAPEVILNEPHLKSDVWAYACTLLQLWLGQSPWSGGERRFSAQDSIPLMFYIANEEVVPFTAEQLERTPRWLQRIARRAFERDVERRCTMAEVLSILTEYSRAYYP